MHRASEHVRRLLRDHDRRSVGVATDHARHDRWADHAKSIHPKHSQFWIHNSADGACARGMIARLHDALSVLRLHLIGRARRTDNRRILPRETFAHRPSNSHAPVMSATRPSSNPILPSAHHVTQHTVPLHPSVCPLSISGPQSRGRYATPLAPSPRANPRDPTTQEVLPEASTVGWSVSALPYAPRERTHSTPGGWVGLSRLFVGWIRSRCLLG
jgi:hypothetical protein